MLYCCHSYGIVLAIFLLSLETNSRKQFGMKTGILFPEIGCISKRALLLPLLLQMKGRRRLAPSWPPSLASLNCSSSQVNVMYGNLLKKLQIISCERKKAVLHILIKPKYFRCSLIDFSSISRNI